MCTCIKQWMYTINVNLITRYIQVQRQDTYVGMLRRTTHLSTPMDSRSDLPAPYLRHRLDIHITSKENTIYTSPPPSPSNNLISQTNHRLHTHTPHPRCTPQTSPPLLRRIRSRRRPRLRLSFFPFRGCASQTQITTSFLRLARPHLRRRRSLRLQIFQP